MSRLTFHLDTLTQECFIHNSSEVVCCCTGWRVEGYWVTQFCRAPPDRSFLAESQSDQHEASVSSLSISTKRHLTFAIWTWASAEDIIGGQAHSGPDSLQPEISECLYHGGLGWTLAHERRRAKNLDILRPNLIPVQLFWFSPWVWLIRILLLQWFSFLGGWVWISTIISLTSCNDCALKNALFKLFRLL